MLRILTLRKRKICVEVLLKIDGDRRTINKTNRGFLKTVWNPLKTSYYKITLHIKGDEKTK